MNDEIIGMILSLIGMALTIISFQARSKRMLLVWQTAGSTFFLISYLFSDGGIAVFLNIIFLVRNILSMKTEHSTQRVRNLVCLGLCLAHTATFVIYSSVTGEWSFWGALPVVGAIFGTIAVAQTDAIRLRLWKYGDSFAWLFFNAHLGLGALGGTLCEIFNEISLAVSLYRFRRSSGKTGTTPTKEG